MSIVGVTSGGTGQSDDGVAMDTDEPLGLSDAVALGQMVEHGVCLVFGEPTIEQGCALALGEAGLARVAVEQTDVVLLAVAFADREVSGVPSPIEGAVGVLAAEAREVVHGEESSRQKGWVAVRGFGKEVLDILRPPIPFCSVMPGHHPVSSWDRYSHFAPLRVGSA
jgi:hypothetical protein